jgi:hypothetical protein
MTRSTVVFLLLCATTVLGMHGNATAASEAPLVAVFTVQDRTGKFTDYLSAQLAESGAFRVIPGTALRARLREEKRESYKECYDRECQIEIGRELAAKKSVSTAVMTVGTLCLVTAVLYDLRRAASEAGASADGACDDNALTASLTIVARKLAAQQTAAIEAARRTSAEEARRQRERDGTAVRINRAEEELRQRSARDRRAMERYRAAAGAVEARRRAKTTRGWISLAASGVCLATAGALYGIGLRQRSDADDAYMASTTQDEMDRHWADVEAGEKKILIGHLFAGVGGAVLVLALYEFLSRPEVPPPSFARRLRIWPMASARGVFVEGRF